MFRICIVLLYNLSSVLTCFSIISDLAPATQQLLALLFGTWFRIVNHSEYNTMSSEAMAKSVAGSLFHTCNDNPAKVEMAVQVKIHHFPAKCQAKIIVIL